MGYRVYINHDCKAVLRQARPRRRARAVPFIAAVLGAMVLAFTVTPMIAPPIPAPGTPDPSPTASGITSPQAASRLDLAARTLPADRLAADRGAATVEGEIPVLQVAAEDEAPVSQSPAEPDPGPDWQTITVERGDSLSLIFTRLGLNGVTLHKVLEAGEAARGLRRILPGQQLEFLVDDGVLRRLRFATEPARTLEISRIDTGYRADWLNHRIDVENRVADASISHSLFLSGQSAGLTDTMIMEMVSLFGWDIDFALDVREGDSFRVLYQERYREGNKIGEGPILAAEFVNQGRAYRAVRYTDESGKTGYYTEDGMSVRKAFLRTPLNFTRISSGFSLGRRHPVLNTIRAHRGVDYAAPSGTPIRASGDGTIVFIGSKGGYGRTIILSHGNTYSTLYAHMSRFASGLRRGNKINQGRVIGYVGMTGLATGPHLHYEFQVSGVHRNPLTVELPKASPIDEHQRQRFVEQTTPLLAELESGTGVGDVLALNSLREANAIVR